MASIPPKVDFNLDAATREDADRRPFTFSMTGKDLEGQDETRTVTMIDPKNIDWRDLAAIERPIEFLRHAFRQEDKDWFSRQEIPAWKFSQLLEAYMKHYGLESSGKSGVLGI